MCVVLSASEYTKLHNIPVEESYFKQIKNTLNVRNKIRSLKSTFYNSSNVKKIIDIKNSVLGQSIFCFAADLGGACAGGLAGKIFLSNSFSFAGKQLLPIAALSLIIFGGTKSVFIVANKTNLLAQNFFVLLTVITSIYVIKYHLDTLAAKGETMGATFAEQFGSVAGGYTGLYFAGSSIDFFGNDFWTSYLFRMILHTATGIGYESCVSTPSPSWVSPLISAGRALHCSLTQTAAYNYPVVLSTLASLRKHKEPKKILAPFFVKLIVSKCGEPKATNKKAKKLHKEISARIFSPIYVLSKIINCGVKQGIVQILQPDMDTIADSLVNATLRSFHDYMNLLQNCPFVNAAQSNFKESYSLKEEYEKNKSTLISSIEALIIKDKSVVKKLTEKGMDKFLETIEVKSLIDSLVTKIQSLEKELIGLSLLSDNNASYLKDITNIHVKYLLIHTFVNFKNFNQELSVVEEENIILEINNSIIWSYLQQTLSPDKAKAVNLKINDLFQLFFNLKSYSHSFAKKCSDAIYAKDLFEDFEDIREGFDDDGCDLVDIKELPNCSFENALFVIPPEKINLGRTQS